MATAVPQPQQPQPEQPRQPKAHPKWMAFKHSFSESNYITDFWNWILTFLSKSAELVLFGSILYSSYQLIPNVPAVPGPVDAVLFLIQQAALDIGGMGLLKLAKKAGLKKDSFPMRIGVILVALMIANVVLATIKHALPMVPGVIFVVIEALLLIARAVMAVLFGHAIHALREEYGDSMITIKDAEELSLKLEKLSSELSLVQQNFQEHLTNFQGQLSTELSKVRESFQGQLSTELSRIHESFQQQLSTELALMQEDFHQYQPMLAVFPQLETQLQFIPHMQAKLQQIESVTVEELRRVNITLEKQALSPIIEAHRVEAQRPVLRALPVGGRVSTPESKSHNMRELSRTTQQGTSEGKFDARAFVFACLETNANLKLAEIEQLALARGQELSQPTISRYRKQFMLSRESSIIVESESSNVKGESSHDDSESSFDERKIVGE
jgi:F0F1-type ATP synthase membrane subunit b/b'